MWGREFTKDDLEKQIQEKPSRYRKKCDISLLYKKVATGNEDG